MGIYRRKDSAYWWMKFDIDPKTRRAPHKQCSTKILVDAPTKEQRKQNEVDAEAKYQQTCIDLRDPAKQAAAALAPSSMTFEAFARWYIDNVVAHFKSPRQATSIVEMFVAHFRDAGGDSLPLSDITYMLVSEWRTLRVGKLPKTLSPLQRELRARMVASGHGQAVKANSVNRDTSCLRPLLKSAVKNGHLAIDPLAPRTIGDDGFQLLRKADTEVARAFTREEFDRFISAIDSADFIYETARREGLALAYAAVSTLLRRGSLLRLTWAYDRRTHFVPLNAKVSIKRARVTPTMRHYLDLLPKTDDFGGVLFPSHYRAGTTHGLTNAEAHVNGWFREVCKRAQVPHGHKAHGVTFHSFRHTGATWLLKAGHSVKAVMKIGGWTNAQLFLNTYCHADEAECDAAVDSLFTVPTSQAAAGA